MSHRLRRQRSVGKGCPPVDPAAILNEAAGHGYAHAPVGSDKNLIDPGQPVLTHPARNADEPFSERQQGSAETPVVLPLQQVPELPDGGQRLIEARHLPPHQ